MTFVYEGGANNVNSFDGRYEYRVIFEEYLTETRCTVRGTITFSVRRVGVTGLRDVSATVGLPFIASVNAGEVITFPVTGEIDRSSVPNLNDFIGIYRLPNDNPVRNFHNFLLNNPQIVFRFSGDNMEGFVRANATAQPISLNLSPVN